MGAGFLMKAAASCRTPKDEPEDGLVELVVEEVPLRQASRLVRRSSNRHWRVSWAVQAGRMGDFGIVHGCEMFWSAAACCRFGVDGLSSLAFSGRGKLACSTDRLLRIMEWGW